jgi:coenzyme F420-reducing hydrogenase gamma subunit
MSFDDVEICLGSEIKPRNDSKTVFLLGECAVRENKDREGAIKVKGCPPKAADILMALTYNTLNKRRATRIMVERIIKTIGYKVGVYHEDFPSYPRYSPPDFDEKHFM